MKKLISLALVAFMMFALAACGGTASSSAPAGSTPSTPASTGDGGSTAAPEGKYPAETVKIGFVTFDTAGEQFLEVQKYFEYLSESLNIEVIYSESITAAEEELAFIESCAAAGCKAIVGYYNIARNESVQLAIDKGMYYYGVAEEDAVYDAFKDNEMYLGGHYASGMDYDAGYAMGKALVDAGSEKLVYVSGGRDFGVQMFIDRSEGFYAAVEEAQGEGKNVEVVYDVSGWPGTDSYSSDQTAALDTDVDGVACSFGAATWLQPIANAGKSDTIKIAASDALLPMYLEPFANGQVTCITSEPNAIFGLSIPLIINALDGNLVRDDNGQAPRVTVRRLTITTAEDYQSYYDIETDGTWLINDKDVLSMITALNPDNSYEYMSQLYVSLSVEEIMARREAQV